MLVRVIIRQRWDTVDNSTERHSTARAAAAEEGGAEPLVKEASDSDSEACFLVLMDDSRQCESKVGTTTRRAQFGQLLCELSGHSRDQRRRDGDHMLALSTPKRARGTLCSVLSARYGTEQLPPRWRID